MACDKVEDRWDALLLWLLLSVVPSVTPEAGGRVAVTAPSPRLCIPLPRGVAPGRSPRVSRVTVVQSEVEQQLSPRWIASLFEAPTVPPLAPRALTQRRGWRCVLRPLTPLTGATVAACCCVAPPAPKGGGTRTVGAHVPSNIRAAPDCAGGGMIAFSTFLPAPVLQGKRGEKAVMRWGDNAPMFPATTIS